MKRYCLTLLMAMVFASTAATAASAYDYPCWWTLYPYFRCVFFQSPAPIYCDYRYFDNQTWTLLGCAEALPGWASPGQNRIVESFLRRERVFGRKAHVGNTMPGSFDPLIRFPTLQGRERPPRSP